MATSNTSKTSKTVTRAEPAADEQTRSTVDPKTNELREPAPEQDEKVVLMPTGASLEVPETLEDNAPVPNRADPFAWQRDEKAAQAANKKEAAKSDEK